MVIFGKKARELVGRVDELESYVKKIKSAQDEHFETLFMVKRELADRLNKGENLLKELALTVENSLDNGEPRKTPQQILKEWFLGDEEGSK